MYFFDGMGIIRAFKPMKTYGDFFDSVYQYLKSCTKIPVSIELINDVYRSESIKSHAREKRGSLSTRTHIKSDNQILLQVKEWLTFFNNIANKGDLLKVN